MAVLSFRNSRAKLQGVFNPVWLFWFAFASLIMFDALILLLFANGVPVVAGKFLRDRGDWPLDFHFIAIDGKPLLGKSKTIRGILLAVLITTLVAEHLGPGWQLGMAIGSLSMAGDLLSSFIKRRLGMPSSSQAPGLDQIPEALLPLAVCITPLGLQWHEVLILVGVFWVLEVVLSRVFLLLHINKGTSE
ncbi:MAG TPA: CDP-archaeol synthase [Gammaproteobacteria bacterium]|nr:CDP-archaeol synthase [Gammaproteobacteria bacterium]